MAFHREFAKPKIVYPEITDHPRFAFDEIETFVNNKVFILPTNDLYLLGVLNSSCAWTYLKTTCSPLQHGFIEQREFYMYDFPIPIARDRQRSEIAALVRKRLDCHESEGPRLGSEIDRYVAALYGL